MKPSDPTLLLWYAWEREGRMFKHHIGHSTFLTKGKVEKCLRVAQTEYLTVFLYKFQRKKLKLN